MLWFKGLIHCIYNSFKFDLLYLRAESNEWYCSFLKQGEMTKGTINNLQNVDVTPPPAIMLPTKQYWLKQREESQNRISLLSRPHKCNFEGQILYLFIT